MRGWALLAGAATLWGCAQIAGLSSHGGAGSEEGGAGDGGGGLGTSGADGGVAGSSGDGSGGAVADGSVTTFWPAPMCGGGPANSCPTGLGDCRGTGCNVSLSSDQDNCGVCGRSCRGGECQEGECLPITIAHNQNLISRRLVAVNALGVTWGTNDGVVQRLPFEPGAQPITLATGEGEIDDVIVDDKFVYLEVDGPFCDGGWCIRRISLVPGAYPATKLVDIGRYATFMATDGQALYLGADSNIIKVPTQAPGLPTIQPLATNQGRLGFNVTIDREYVYWGSNGDTEGIVKRIRMDGTDLAPQHLASGIKEVVGVGVDDVNVYWTAGASGMVQSAPKTGTGPITTLVTDTGGASAVVMAIDELNVYWGGSGGDPDLKKVSKCGGPLRYAAHGHSVFGIVPWMGNVYYSDSAYSESGIYRVAQ